MPFYLTFRERFARDVMPVVELLALIATIAASFGVCCLLVAL